MVKFEAGSYSLDNHFISSIGRFEGNGKEWTLGMMLVKMESEFSFAEEAAVHAKIDIDRAQQAAIASQGASTIDHELVKRGYNRLDQDA